MTPAATQSIPVKGIVNARDLGGYAMQDGRRLRSGLLIRSAHLADAAETDIAFLASLPVTRIVDFRLREELRGKADKPVPGAEYTALPIDASGNAIGSASEKEKKQFIRGKKFNVNKIIVTLAFNKKAQAVAGAMYPTLVFNPECQKQFARFFRIVLETESGALLYHCTQGKDRTGIASALLLAALGASRETIIADFDATNRVYEADVRKYTRRVKFWGGKEKETAVVKSFLGANTDNFIKTLDAVKKQYGSLDAYLKGPMDLTENDIQTLKNRYLE